MLLWKYVCIKVGISVLKWLSEVQNSGCHGFPGQFLLFSTTILNDKNIHTWSVITKG